MCNTGIIRHSGNRCCEDNGAVGDRTGHINSIVGMHDQIYGIQTNKKNGAAGDFTSIESISSLVR